MKTKSLYLVTALAVVTLGFSQSAISAQESSSSLLKSYDMTQHNFNINPNISADQLLTAQNLYGVAPRTTTKKNSSSSSMSFFLRGNIGGGAGDVLTSVTSTDAANKTTTTEFTTKHDLALNNYALALGGDYNMGQLKVGGELSLEMGNMKKTLEEIPEGGTDDFTEFKSDAGFVNARVGFNVTDQMAITALGGYGMVKNKIMYDDKEESNWDNNAYQFGVEASYEVSDGLMLSARYLRRTHLEKKVDDTFTAKQWNQNLISLGVAYSF